jgi:hypothetical protein
LYSLEQSTSSPTENIIFGPEDVVRADRHVPNLCNLRRSASQPAPHTVLFCS